MEDILAVLSLGKTPCEYTFSIDWRYDPPILHIPGNHRGPDVCIPYRQEQVDWLDSLKDMMIAYWDCQWKFLSRGKCHEFIELLKECENGKG